MKKQAFSPSFVPRRLVDAGSLHRAGADFAFNSSARCADAPLRHGGVILPLWARCLTGWRRAGSWRVGLLSGVASLVLVGMPASYAQQVTAPRAAMGFDAFSGVLVEPRSGGVIAKGPGGPDDEGDPGEPGPDPLPYEPTTAALGVTPGQFGVDAGGEATYRVPLQVAPGVGGMAPSVSLTYRSGAGNGLLGMGFSLSADSSISRGGRTLREDGEKSLLRFAQDDVLYLDGVRLYAVQGEPGGAGTVYESKEKTFVKVVGEGDIQSPNASFVAYLPDGGKLFYGRTADSRVYLNVPSSDQASVTPLVYRWALTRREDREGNGINYTYGYEVDAGGVQHHRLETIAYTDNAGQGLTAKREVRFLYSKRDDVLRGYFHGVLLQQRYLLDAVEVWGPTAQTHEDGLDAIDLIRVYHFSYERPSITGRSLLTSLVECSGEQGQIGTCKDRTHFRYELGELGFETGTDETFSFSGVPYPAGFNDAWSQGGFFEKLPLVKELTGDFTGDGQTDLLVGPDLPTGAIEVLNWALWPSTGWHAEGDYTPQYLQLQADVLFDSERLAIAESPGSRVPALVVNYNGDHLSDVLYRHNIRYYGDADAPKYVVLEATGDPADPFTRKELPGGDKIFLSGDYNGDGLSDLVYCQRTSDDEPDVEWQGFGSPAYQQGRTFAYVLNTGHGLNMTDAVSTQVPCSGRDLYLQMDADGNGALDLLMVLGVDKAGEPLTPAQWTDYQRVVFDFKGQQAWLEDAGLPVDRYQRWRGSSKNTDCQNVLIGGHQLGMDRLVDVNGDGLLDVLRLELAAGDGNEQMAVIKAYRLCDNPQDDLTYFPEPGVVRLYENTGKGFKPGDVVTSFIHRGVIDTHFKQSVVLDLKVNGRGGLLIPDPSATHPMGWHWLSLNMEGKWENHALKEIGGLNVGYDRYAHFPISDHDGDGLHDVMIKSEGRWDIYPHKGRVPDLLVAVRDGQGNRDQVSYAPEQQHLRSHEALPAGVSGNGAVMYPRYHERSVRPVVTRSTHDNGAGAREYSYRYYQPVADRLGAGRLGYRAKVVHEAFKNDPQHTGVDERESVYVYDNGTYVEALKRYPYAGAVTEFRDYARFKNSAGQATVRVNRSRQGHTYQSLPDGSYRSYVQMREQQAYELEASACKEQLRCTPDILGKHTPLTAHRWEALELDEWGRITLSESRDQGEYYDQAPLSKTQVRVEYTDLPGPWVWGLVTLHEQTNTVPLAGSETRTQRFAYDEKGRLTSAVREPGDADLELVQRYGYDGFGNVNQIEMKASQEQVWRQVHVDYDAEGLFVRQLHMPLGHSETYSFDRGLGVVTRLRDVTGLTSYQVYDDFGRPMAGYQAVNGTILGSVVYTDYEKKALGQDDEGLGLWGLKLRTYGDELGTSQIETDRYGRPIYAVSETVFGKQIESFMGYDHRGRVQRVLLPKFSDGDLHGYSEYAYNALDEVLKIKHPNNTQTHYYRDKLRQGVKDASDRWTIQEADRLGRIVHTKGPFTCPQDGIGCLVPGGDEQLIATMRYQFGAFSHLRTIGPLVADEKMPSIQIVTDKYGQRLQLQDTATGTRTSRYNAYGELIEDTDAQGNSKVYTYDLLGRMTQILHDQGVEKFFYDGQYKGLPDGSQSSKGHIQRLFYDTQRRPYRTETQIQGEGVHEVFAFEYAYDGLNRLKEIRYPQMMGAPQIGVRHHYDGLGHLVKVTNTLNDKLYWELDEIDHFGNMTRSRLGNGAAHHQRYNAQTGLIERIETVHPDTGVVQELTYLFTPGGDLEARHDGVFDQLEDFEYDGVGRLRHTVAQRGDKVLEETFNYDGLGNLLSRSKAGTYQYQGPHLQSIVDGTISYTYDKNGNMRTRNDLEGITTFYYNPFEQIERIKDPKGNLLAYEYDAGGSRVRRLDMAKGQITIYAGGLYERESSASAQDKSAKHRYRVMSPQGMVAELELAQDPEGEFSEINERYVVRDHLNSVDVAMNEKGEAIHRLSFDSFGLHRNAANWTDVYPQQYQSDVPIDLGFTGHRGKRDGGVVDMGARLYDPLAARFLNADPIISNPLSSQRLNRYSYVLNRPQNLTDPSGMSPEGEGDAGGGSCWSAQGTCPPPTSDVEYEPIPEPTGSYSTSTGSASSVTSGDGQSGAAHSGGSAADHLRTLGQGNIDSDDLSPVQEPSLSNGYVYEGMWGDILGATESAEAIQRRHDNAVARMDAQSRKKGQESFRGAPSNVALGYGNDMAVRQSAVVALSGLALIGGYALVSGRSAGLGAQAAGAGGKGGGGFFRSLWQKIRGKDKGSNKPSKQIAPAKSVLDDYGISPITDELLLWQEEGVLVNHDATRFFPNTALVVVEYEGALYRGGNEVLAVLLQRDVPGTRTYFVNFGSRGEIVLMRYMYFVDNLGTGEYGARTGAMISPADILHFENQGLHFNLPSGFRR